MPAWKLKACIDDLQVRPIDLAALAETTGVQFASAEMVDLAAESGTAAVTSSHDEEPKEENVPDLQEKKSEVAENSTEKTDQSDKSTDAGDASKESKSKDTDTDEQQQDATASQEESKSAKNSNMEKEQSKKWITIGNVVNAGHHVLWPQGMTPSTGPTLLTGVKVGDEDRFVDNFMEWERKVENANWDDHVQFLRNAQLTAEVHPMKLLLGKMDMSQKRKDYPQTS